MRSLGDVCAGDDFGGGLDRADKLDGGIGQAEGQRQSEELRETVLLHLLPVVGRRQLVFETTSEYSHETVRVRFLRVQSGQGRAVGHARVQSAQQEDVLPVLVHSTGPRRLVRAPIGKQPVSFENCLNII